jgi:hypothetical protein
MVIDDALTFRWERLQMTPNNPNRQPVIYELLAGEGGAWLAGIFDNGETEFAWMVPNQDRENPEHAFAYIARPVANYRAAFSVATYGRRLAAAFRLDDTNWQLVWIDPAPTDPADPSHTGSVVALGPRFALHPTVRRPGGIVDGERLLLAGATTTDRITVWEVPFGAPESETLQPVGAVAKISRLVPARLGMAIVGGHTHVVWTERIPATATGFEEYTALYAGLLAPIPAPTP